MVGIGMHYSEDIGVCKFDWVYRKFEELSISHRVLLCRDYMLEAIRQVKVILWTQHV